MANLKFFNPATNQWEEFMLNTRLNVVQNTITLPSATDHVSIGISSFNPVDDFLFVVQNSTVLVKGVDYTISGDGLSIYTINSPYQTWAVNTQLSFLVFKNVQRNVPSADGSLIQQGSITDDKLFAGIQISPTLVDNKGKTYTTFKDRMLGIDKRLDSVTSALASYNVSGSNQTTLGSINAASNVLTVTDVKDFDVGQGIVVSGAIIGTAAVYSLTIANPCTTAGTVTLTLDGVSQTVNLTTADNTSSLVATKIRNMIFSGWLIGGTANTVVFTSTSHGARQALTYDPSTTGATGSVITNATGVADGDLYSIVIAKTTTTLTLRENASYTVSSVIIKHDDTEAFQSAINDTITNSRKEIFVPTPKNQYNIRALTNANMIRFVCDGSSFLLGSYPVNSISKNADDITNLYSNVNTLTSNIGNITQLATVNKTSTVASVNEVNSNLNTHITDSVAHVTQSDRNTWNGKVSTSQLNDAICTITQAVVPFLSRSRNSFAGDNPHVIYGSSDTRITYPRVTADNNQIGKDSTDAVFTVNQAGKYLVLAHGQINRGNDGDAYSISIKVNGTFYETLGEYKVSSVMDSHYNVSVTLNLQANDSFEIWTHLKQTTGDYNMAYNQINVVKVGY